MGLGPWELAIILVIVLLIFGVGRITKLGSELGRSVSAFRQGLQDGKDELADEDGAEKEA